MALIKEYKKLTDEQKKQPIMLIFESFSIIGLMLLIIGVVIFENLLLGNIAITLFIIGIIFNIIRCGKSNSIFRMAMALGLALFILVLYIFFFH